MNKSIHRCPYDDSREPSLIINWPEKTFQCMNCGAHGDVGEVEQILAPKKKEAVEPSKELDVIHKAMGNKPFTCNYCGKRQTLVIPHREADGLREQANLIKEMALVLALSHDHFQSWIDDSNDYDVWIFDKMESVLKKYREEGK